jgi:uncharacterized membrane protein
MAFYNFGLTTPRILLAASLCGLGIEHFLFGDFVTGRAPAYPEAFPGRLVFAYGSGLLLLASAITMLARKKIPELIAFCAVTILIWAAGRNIILLVMRPEYGGLLTNTFKGLTLGFGLFIIANSFIAGPSTGTTKAFIRLMALACPYFVGLFLLVAGIQHFIFADFVNFLVPPWMPFVSFWTYFTGVALVAAGLGIITGFEKYWAARLSGCMVLVWVVVLHLPRAFEHQNQNEWISVFEALAFGAILLTMAEEKREVIH